MILHLISPENAEIYNVNWLKVDTPCGNLTIQPGHAPIILTLLADKDISLSLHTGEKKKIRLTRPGFLEVTRDGATALVNEKL